MPHMGRDIWDLPSVPPPQLGAFKPVRIVKKAGKGIAKGAARGAKGIAKVSKAALMAAARLAAKPVKMIFRKLAMRRARLLSWKDRKSLKPDKGEKLAAVAWSLARMRSKGPIGKLGVKILTFTKGATLGQLTPMGRQPLTIMRDPIDPTVTVGMTGAEIAAAAAAIVGALSSLMASLNKPGEAPADPRTEEATEETTET